MCRSSWVLLLLPCALAWNGLTVQAAPAAAAQQPAPGAQEAALTAAEAQELIKRTLANELRAAQDSTHPMRYELRKTSPRLTTTKLIVETRDGDVARLVSVNDEPLSAPDEKKEEDRLDTLLADPSRQRHRKQGEDADSARALKVLRALPKAFLYTFAGNVPPAHDGGSGAILRFTFKPNPAFSAGDLETEALTVMTGEIWIDPDQERVTHLEGHLQQDVDFGWGILGRLSKGGSILIEQADVDAGQWRIVHFKMGMSGRVLFKSKVFDTVEDETRFTPLPVGLTYQKAIEMLRSDPSSAPHCTR